jgi:DNA repair exonuclease SbcCD nuclease subunit
MGVKVALIADTHAGARNDNPYMLENFRQSCRWFFDYLRSYRPGVEAIIHLGDVYDRHKYINFITAKAVREEFYYPAQAWETHIIAGNHDEYFKDTHTVCSLVELMPISQREVMTCYTMPYKTTIGGHKVVLVPWITTNSNRDATELFLAEHAEDAIVFAHAELKGFEMYKNTGPMKTGDDHSMYAKARAVYSGHFHKRSQRDNVNYIGAFGEYTWSDAGCPRGFSILDLETLELEFIRNPYTMFEQLTYNDEQWAGLSYQQNDYSSLKGKYVKVLVEKRTDEYSFDVMMDRINEADPADVVIDEDFTTFTDAEEDAAIEVEGEDTPMILDNYIEGLTMAVEKPVMKNYMRDLYKEALTVNATAE